MSKLLMAFVTTVLFFMLFPGTFLSVWNLLQISGRESVASISSTAAPLLPIEGHRTANRAGTRAVSFHFKGEPFGLRYPADGKVAVAGSL